MAALTSGEIRYAETGERMANVSITRKDSVVDQLEQIRHRIAQRAYELFRHRDGVSHDRETKRERQRCSVL